MLELLPSAEGSAIEAGGQSLYLTEGECAFDLSAFQSLVESLGLADNPRSLVINPPSPAELSAQFPALRQAVIVPLSDRQKLFGWFGAFDHRSGGEFGTPEASLLGSVTAQSLPFMPATRSFIASKRSSSRVIVRAHIGHRCQRRIYLRP